jgi:probable addiction module antidote protein
VAAKKKQERARDFDDYLIKALKDPELASEYLNAAMADGDIRVFLMALGDVAKAVGMSKIAAATELDRANIYRAVSDAGNPLISTVAAIMEAIGLRITTEPIHKVAVNEDPLANALVFETRAGMQAAFEPMGSIYMSPGVEVLDYGVPVPTAAPAANQELALAA